VPVSSPPMDAPVVITGHDLDVGAVRAIARDGAPVVVDPVAHERMAAGNAVVRRAAQSGRPVYGVTTGLGSRAMEPVRDASGAEFSLRTIRGRATAVGEPLPRDQVRAAMAIRLNGLCAGGAGAGPGLADGLAGLLNHGVHPEVPRSGSLGAADLCLMAHVGLVLIGEGRAELDGEWLDAAQALTRAGLATVVLGPKDGLAICSSSSVAIGAATLALADAEACLQGVQVATALSMEGFRANLSPLDPRAVAARPAPGQAWSADGLRTLLDGGTLARTPADRARRVQDPLSYRCASQVNGSLRTALDHLAQALEPDLNGAADNPLVLVADEEILSTGNFQGPALALALDATAIGVAQVAHAAAERQARLKTSALSGLPPNLVDPGPAHPATRSGVAPLSKTAHALVLEIRHLAAPLAIHGMVTADGVEDDSTGATQAALRLLDQLARLRSLIAVELLVSAQAVDVAGAAGQLELGRGTSAAHRCVREVAPTLGEDRPLGREVTRLEQAAFAGGALLHRVGAAIEAASLA
jgi:histidine ammonia-lyase